MSNNDEFRLFEGDNNFTGKHATYIKFLKDEGLYERYVDVVLNASVFGFMYGRKAKKDSESSDRARVYSDVMSKEKSNFIFLLKLILLLDGDDKLSVEKRVDRAFRDTEKGDPELDKKHFNIFMEYVLGGIEVMYELFTSKAQSKEEYIFTTYEIMKNFREEIEGINYEEEIKALMNEVI